MNQWGRFNPRFPSFVVFRRTAQAGIKLRLMGCKGYFRPRKTGHKQNMGVSKNRGGPPKWMVKIMENPIKMDDLGVPLFLEKPI